MDIPMLAKQQNHTFFSSVQTLDAIEKIFQKWWPIGMDSERELRESVLSACLDDNEFKTTWLELEVI